MSMIIKLFLFQNTRPPSYPTYDSEGKGMWNLHDNKNINITRCPCLDSSNQHSVGIIGGRNRAKQPDEVSEEAMKIALQYNAADVRLYEEAKVCI